MSSSKTAHDVKRHQRTQDIKIEDDVNFEGLLLSDPVLQGLKSSGFERPSPIQLKAIPLGRCGLDLIVQAKSGTGKTCVFSVVALEGIIVDSCTTQVLIIAPTREIAVQIWEVINAIGSKMPKLRCYTFIGGLPVLEDIQKLKKCHVAVGTPGRLKQLMELGALIPSSVRLFVLDEADKLMEEGMQEDINWLFSQLPDNKQMLALSATYPEVLAQHLTVYMRNPTFIRLNSQDPALLGIRQYYRAVLFHPLPQKAFSNKVTALKELLSRVEFRQCLVFSNYQLRAQSLAAQLTTEGWPATYISGSQDQEHRLTAMARLKRFKCRVLVSTDLTSRGIDAEHVNLVVNLDIPNDHETYLHRIGRAGRFGTYGAAVTFVLLGKEMDKLKVIEEKCNTKIKVLPAPTPPDLASSSGYVNISHLVSTERIITETNEDSNSIVGDGLNVQSSSENSTKVLTSSVADDVKRREGEAQIIANEKDITDYKSNTSLRASSIDKSGKTVAISADVSISLPEKLSPNTATALGTQPENLSALSLSESNDGGNTSTFVFKAPLDAGRGDVDPVLSDTVCESVKKLLMSPMKTEMPQSMNWSLSEMVDEFDRYMKKEDGDVTVEKEQCLGNSTLDEAQIKNYSELLDQVSVMILKIKEENEQLLGKINSNVRQTSSSSPTDGTKRGAKMSVIQTFVKGSDITEDANKYSESSVLPNASCSDVINTDIDASEASSSLLTNTSKSEQRVGFSGAISVLNTDHMIDSATTCKNGKISKKSSQMNLDKKPMDDLSYGKEYMQLLKCKDAIIKPDSSSSEQSGYDSDGEDEVDETGSENSYIDSGSDGYSSDDKENESIRNNSSKTKQHTDHSRHKKVRKKKKVPTDQKKDVKYWEQEYTPDDHAHYEHTTRYRSTEEYYADDYYGDGAAQDQSYGYANKYEQGESGYEPQYQEHYYNEELQSRHDHMYTTEFPGVSPQGNWRFGGHTSMQQSAHENTNMSSEFLAGWQSCYAYWMSRQAASASAMNLSDYYMQLHTYHQQQAEWFMQQYKRARKHESLARIYHSQKNYIKIMARNAVHQ